ncbi:MAG TPA: hypothetical protein DER40_00685 [Geobacter sp.]|nr:MAG: hypothetical protein A2X85_05795 [Geobacteraceae bacterium GWF2_54_21]HBA72828.1 hypothetical protein [Geobacter sp.]HCE66068.1 hypothetical protein [Geobacter sp.]
MQENLLILDEDKECRKQMAQMFTKAGYHVKATNSVTSAMYDVLKKTVQVVLLGGTFDDLSAADLVPLLKQCNNRLRIILVAAESSLPLIRKLRKDGIFYHALKPHTSEDRAEIVQAVACAFRNMDHMQAAYK